MNLDSAPRLPKLPFIIGDAVLLLIAGILAMLSPRPLDTITVVIIAILVVLGAALLVAPFILDYAAASAEAVERERERVNEQTARLHAATESLARAAAQIKAVEEAVHKAAREAETLPYRMQEKLAEFNEALAAKEESDREALESELEELRAAHAEQLKIAAEKLAKATAELVAVEAATRKQGATHEAVLAKFPAAATAAATKIDESLARATHELDARLRAVRDAAAAIRVPATAPVVATPPAPPAESHRAPEPVVAPAPVSAPPAAVAEPAAAEVNGVAPAAETPASPATPAEIAATVTPVEPAAETAKPKKPRAPRKPKPEENLLAMSQEATTPASADPAAATEPVAAAEVSEPEPLEATSSAAPTDEAAPDNSDIPASRAESSSSSDGATRLLATAYIGIGNKLFIRGDGPGLTWDRGVPMQFVSIGKWGWSTQEAAGPIRCKLYKNDETAALTGEIVLESGRHTEITALF